MKHTVLKEDVIRVVDEHNKRIDDYINGELADKLGAKDGKIKLDMWFKAQELINEKHFYEKAIDIMNFLRRDGWDVKRDAQSNKLRFYGSL